jgi:hypothetical protein
MRRNRASPWRLALAIARPGSVVGAVEAPHDVDIAIMDTVVFRNVGLRGDVSPARVYIPELVNDVLNSVMDPAPIFDFETDLDHVREAYAAMDDRRAVKSFLRIGSVQDSVERRCRFWTEPTRGFPVSTRSRRAGARDKLWR